MKKILLALMVIAISINAFGTVSAEVETEGIYTYRVVNGGAWIEECDNSICGDLIIPDNLGGYPVTWIYSGAFSG